MRVTIGRSSKKRLLRGPLQVVNFSVILSELETAIMDAKALDKNVFAVFPTPINLRNNIPFANGDTYTMTVGFLRTSITGKVRDREYHYDDAIKADQCERALREACQTLADYFKEAAQTPSKSSDTFDL